MQIHRITYVLLGLVIIVGTISIATQRGRVQTSPARQKKSPATQKQLEDEARNRFPTAEFDEEEPSDPQKQVAFRKRKVRHNNLGLVDKNPGPNTGGGVFLPEGMFDFPALPTGQSDAVVFGEVLNAQAHLSQDKGSVYSEFTIRLKTIFKSAGSLGEQITVERIGGYVKFPDGRRLFYRLGSSGMPRVGGKYFLFLKSIPQSEDFTILTGYELGTDGVSPLDFSGQFEAYRGYSENSFLIDVSSALAKPPTVPELK